MKHKVMIINDLKKYMYVCNVYNGKITNTYI